MAADSISMNPVVILASATRRCWEEYVSVIILSALWFLAQVLIIPGPPMTAALCAMARSTTTNEYWGAADVWGTFKALFWPAWRWALPNAVIVGIAVYNLSAFWAVPGASWAILKAIWLTVLLVVIGINLFYWPFYLAAEDTSMRAVYANCGRFWLLHPGTAVVLLLVAVIVAITSVSWLLPVILGVVFWVALGAQTAVQRSLGKMASAGH